jgi:hypothetical protein
MNADGAHGAEHPRVERHTDLCALRFHERERLGTQIADGTKIDPVVV